MRVRDSAADRPMRPIDDIVVGQATPVLLGSLVPVVTIAARTAEIHLQYGVAAIHEELLKEKVLAVVPRDRTPMRHHDQRQRTGRRGQWLGQAGGGAGPSA